MKFVPTLMSARPSYAEAWQIAKAIRPRFAEYMTQYDTKKYWPVVCERFPPDFMFQLSKVEFENLKSQIVTSNCGGLRRAGLYAFTEQGVAMLSSVLNSRRAVQVNIEIMRAFVRLREIMATHKDLVRRLNEMEKKYDAQFRVVFDAIRELMAPPQPNNGRSGFW